MQGPYPAAPLPAPAPPGAVWARTLAVLLVPVTLMTTLPAVSAAATYLASVTVSRQFELSAPLAIGDVVTVRPGPRGLLVVEGTPGRVVARMRAEARAVDPAGAREAVDRLSPRLDRTSDGLTVDGTGASGSPSGVLVRAGQLEMQVPPGTPLTVRAEDADVSLRGVSGRVDVQSRAGSVDLRVPALSTSANIKTDSGSIHFSGSIVDGDLELFTYHGPVTMEIGPQTRATFFGSARRFDIDPALNQGGLETAPSPTGQFINGSVGARPGEQLQHGVRVDSFGDVRLRAL